MEAVCISETLVYFHETTRRYILKAVIVTMIPFVKLGLKINCDIQGNRFSNKMHKY